MSAPLGVKEPVKQGICIYTLLFRSHMMVATLGMAALLTSMGAMLVLRRAAIHYASVSGPSARNAAVALAGTQRTLAALRGWVNLNDPQFIEERKRAWQEEVDPAIASMEQISPKWTNLQDRELLKHVRQELNELRRTQWWIEDISQTPGNQPGRRLADTKLKVLGDKLRKSFAALIELEKARPKDQQRFQLISDINCARYHFIESKLLLIKYLDTGVDGNVANLERHRTSASTDLAILVSQREEFSDRQLVQLDQIQMELPAFYRTVDEIVAWQRRPDANVSQALLREQCVPMAQRVIGLLTTISEDQEQVMQTDRARLEALENLGVFLWLGLLASMLVAAVMLSRRYARSLAVPIAKLSEASHRLANGHFDTEVPESSIDDVAQLSDAFRDMNVKLFVKTKTLREMQERFRVTIDASLTAMLTVDAMGNIVVANTAAENLFGYDLGELVGQPIEILVPHSIRERHPHLRNGYFKQPRPYAMGQGRDLKGVRKDGTDLEVEVGLYPDLHHGRRHGGDDHRRHHAPQAVGSRDDTRQRGAG